MKLLCRGITAFLVSAFAVSTVSYALPSANYCVRVYCKEELSSKIRTEEGQRFFPPAYYDGATDSYLISRNNFEFALKRCNLNASIRKLPGTDAKKLEKSPLTSWIVIKPSTKYLQDNQIKAIYGHKQAACTILEKRQ